MRDVRLSLVATQTAYRTLTTTEELLRNASQALELARARYKVGSSSIVEMSEAQLNQTEAAIAYANAAYGERIQSAVLDYQTGTLR